MFKSVTDFGFSWMCTDGASVFKGTCTGVITQLQEKHAPFIEGVHCMVSSHLLFFVF
jgi:hypothetical protein